MLPIALDDLSLRQRCGQLIVGGFHGEALPSSYRAALQRGERGGAIVFRRNLVDLEQVAALCRSIAQACPESLPPFIGVDQEGGRVTRLPAPFLALPAMRELGVLDDLHTTQKAAQMVARELRALGFNLNFAPVMDVDSNPANPVIGDRAFGCDPRSVMTHGVAFLRGLQQEGVLACAKHFPGHGDTALDSHLALPRVEHSRERLNRIELPPFRAASGAGVAAMMTAHVVYDGLEADVPATFSRAVCESLLRAEIGFDGVLFCDDLEMGAVSQKHTIADGAVEAVWAGCDALLICSSEEKQQLALDALVQRAEKDDRFRRRCELACQRSLRIRRLSPPRIEAEGWARDAIGTPAATDFLAALTTRIKAARSANDAAPSSGPRAAAVTPLDDASHDPTERQ